MNIAKPIRFLRFDSPENPLVNIQAVLNSQQSNYIYKYLKHLNCKSLIVEDNYFDRDFLSEVSAVYSSSAKGYPNVCIRVHFFSTDAVTRDGFIDALGDNKDVINEFQNNYLGFIVIRPITDSPFGRTVLSWYPDQEVNVPRVITPSRTYISTIAGLELSVKGLAWQQQDSGVAACATIGIWSMLHSSAFDAQHSIPTTSEITEAAHSSAIVGHRTYPSYALTYPQILHAINKLGFAPSQTNGDQPAGYFSKERFSNICAAFIRSGYPILVGGNHGNHFGVGHAVCAVGFREGEERNDTVPGDIYLQDEQVDYIYIHDDNIGPNVRFKLESEEYTCDGKTFSRCVMKMETPNYLVFKGEPNLDNISLYPKAVIAAVHNDLMISADGFFNHGRALTQYLGNILNTSLESVGVEKRALAFSSRFLMLKEYLKDELGRQLSGENELLASVRIQLQESVVPMSLHLAVLRIALPDSSIMIDIIFDTTDTDRNRTVFCHVVYDSNFAQILDQINPEFRKRILGEKVIAF